MTNIDLKRQPTIISFFKDLPNICSLAGLLCSVFAIYFTILGNFSAGLIGIIWAVLFDWADGIIARRIDGRTDHQRAFGGQLDSLIDIVSFGVFPAVFLLSYGKFSPWFVPFAFIIVASSAMRLSYFNLFGLSEDNRYVGGLALDNNVIILSAFFLLEPFFQTTIFAVMLCIIMTGLIVLNLSSVKTPKLTGRWFYVLIIYTLFITTIYALK